MTTTTEQQLRDALDILADHAEVNHPRRDEIMAQVEAALALPGGAGWIATAERLPEQWITVLVAKRDGHTGAAYYTRLYWMIFPFEQVGTDKVTHWMPLPPPPPEAATPQI